MLTPIPTILIPGIMLKLLSCHINTHLKESLHNFMKENDFLMDISVIKILLLILNACAISLVENIKRPYKVQERKSTGGMHIC